MADGVEQRAQNDQREFLWPIDKSGTPYLGSLAPEGFKAISNRLLRISAGISGRKTAETAAAAPTTLSRRE